MRRGGDVAAIVKMIREKRARLEKLERAARELRAHLKAVRVSVNVRPTRGRRPQAPRVRHRPVWPSTIAGCAVAALEEAGKPMRVTQLLRAIERRSGKKIAPATLVGQLARDVRRGRVFRRTAPSEYALAAWNHGRRKR